MILTCPSCGTQYAVRDGAIPEGGRKVRCATCGHSWHQDPEAAAPQEAEAAPPQPEAVAEPELPADTVEFDAGPGETPEAYEEVEPIAPGAPLVEPPAAVPVPPPDEDFVEAAGPESDFEEEEDPGIITKELPDADEIAAVRSETGADRKRSWLMAVLLGMIVVVAIVALLWFVAPDSVRRTVGLASAGATPLQIAPGTPERQKLASGNELVVVSGRVVNPSAEPQQVPPIEAQLRDRSGRLIYSWTIAPPARVLPPGGSATFNSAEMDVPASGLDSTVTLTLKG